MMQQRKTVCFEFFAQKSFHEESCENLKFSFWAKLKTLIKILFFKQKLPIGQKIHTQNRLKLP
jgi:hypothetical protein